MYAFMIKFIVVLLFGVVILGAAVFGVQFHKSEKPLATRVMVPRLEKVVVAQAFEVFLYAPLYVAQDKGFFKEEGLDVSIVTAGGDEKAFAALLSKTAQFAIGDPTFVAVAGERGQPGKVIAALLSGMPFWGVTHKSSIPTIDDPKMLKDLKVATFPSPSTAYAAQTKMFQSAGLDPNIQQVAFGGLLAALESNQVDIALELEPNVSTAVKYGHRVVYSLAKYYPDFAITGITVLPEYERGHVETVQHFTNAIRKADVFIAEHLQDAANIMVKRFPQVDQDVAKDALRNMVQARVIPTSMVVSRVGWDTAIQLRTEVGDIAKLAPYDSYVETEYARKADGIVEW